MSWLDRWRSSRLSVLLGACCIGPALAASLSSQDGQIAPQPQWIWDAQTTGNAVCRVRRVFEVKEKVTKAQLRVTADNEFTAWLQGERVLRGRDWKRSFFADVTRKVTLGPLLLAIQGKNEGGQAGLIGELTLEYASGARTRLVTDGEWEVCAGRGDDETWRKDPTAPAPTRARVLGPLGMSPWGDPFAPRLATPASALGVRSGYTATLVRSASEWQGSWVSMTFDPKGQLYIGVERDGILRLANPLASPLASPLTSEAEFLDLPPTITNVQGMTFAHGALWVNVNLNDDGGGLFRLRDADDDGQFEDVQRMFQWKGDGEHGAHAIVPGPDGWLYVINGNMTNLPKELAATSPHRLYAEDVLLPPIEDPNGHAVGVKAPGSHVLRFKPDGSIIELFAAGMRNAYDLAFDAVGELYTFDSDMEWDIGLPWYRPVRVCHLVSGAEFGWRSGTGCWPVHFFDSLPPLVDIGRGSPTGVTFWYGDPMNAGHGHFVAADWSLGRILLVDVQTGQVDTLVSGKQFAPEAESGRVTPRPGKPLNVSDVVVGPGVDGPDGALWFITGGRGTQSGLYRLGVATGSAASPRPTERDAVRLGLERFHARPHAEAIDAAWPSLGAATPALRQVARVAVERQPVLEWRARALAESDPARARAALLALSRAGARDDLAAVVDRWLELDLGHGDRVGQLEALRVLAVAFARHGRPDEARRIRVLAALPTDFSGDDLLLARERAALLVFLRAPEIVPPLLAVLLSATSQADQIAFAFLLSHVADGWSDATLAQFGKWLQQARAHLGGGVSFEGYLDAIRATFIERLRDPALQAQAKAWPKPASRAAAAVVAPGPFVRAWTVEELAPHLAAVTEGRSFTAGERAARSAQCIVCHRFGTTGGSIGPDLTTLSSRFSRRDILEAIVEPSKVIADQYRLEILALRDGTTTAGRILRETADEIVLLIEPIAHTTQTVRPKDVLSRTPSPVSSMPPGLINSLTREQILDLLAYFENEGDKEADAFK